MKVIVIYGQPATGKLTLAKEIAKIKGYKVFDNHCLIDFLEPIVLSKTDHFRSKVSQDFFALYRKVRLDVLNTACKLKDINGIIFTEAYTGKKRFVTSIIDIAKKNKCEVYLVKLKCDLKTLEKRVYEKSRKKYGKLKDKQSLHKWIEKRAKSDSVYPFKNTLVLDTTNQSLKNSINKILKFINNK
ncbi:MAG: hypothetical protein ABIE22_03740 [archaeon]